MEHVYSSDRHSTRRVDREYVGETVELWKLRLQHPQERLSTAAVVETLAHRVGDVLSVHTSFDGSGPVWEVVLETPCGTAADAVIADLAADGLRAVLRPADVHDFLNPQARCLALVEEVRGQPHRLVDVAAQLLDAEVVGPDDALGSAGTAAPGERMELSRAGHSFAQLRRPGLAFSCGEAAEVQALARLASPDKAKDLCEQRLVLRDGHEVTVRMAQPRDRGFIRALRGSSSLRVLGSACPGTGYRPSGGEPGAGSPRPLVTLVATGPVGERVAAARLLPSPATGVGEVCLVVQERWQQRGLGAALLLQSLAAARHRGLTQLRTVLHPSDRAMHRSFLEAGATLTPLESSPLVAVSLPTELPAVSVSCGDASGSCAGRSCPATGDCSEETAHDERQHQGQEHLDRARVPAGQQPQRDQQRQAAHRRGGTVQPRTLGRPGLGAGQGEGADGDQQDPALGQNRWCHGGDDRGEQPTEHQDGEPARGAPYHRGSVEAVGRGASASRPGGRSTCGFPVHVSEYRGRPVTR